jgi:xanthosine utilization system XapX-like protein
MKFRQPVIVTGAICLLARMLPAVSQPVPLPPSPQDRGLAYTRSADAAALAKIRGGIAVFPGSRYGYVGGLRVRLDDENLLCAEAVLKDGVVYVPGPFAALVGVKGIYLGQKVNRSGKPLYHDRLIVNRRTSSVNFRMLLLPMRAGDPLPTVNYDAVSGIATVVFATQSDTLHFSIGEDKRTRLSASSGGRSLIDP